MSGHPSDQWVACITVDAAENATTGVVSVAAVEPTGQVRELGRWDVLIEVGAPVVASRSPDRSTVAVLVHETLIHAGPSLPPTDPAVTASPTVAGGTEPATPAIVWPGGDGTPAVAFLNSDATVNVDLERGWALELTGEIVEDAGHTGHHSSFSSVFAPPGTVPEVLDAAIREFRAYEATVAKERTMFRCALTCDGTRTVVHEESRSAVEGVSVVHWPPIVGTFGVLLRRSVKTVVLPPDERAGAHTEMQHPWVVGPDGTVRTIPTALGVSPLCELPDGRLLLRGADPLWLDGGDQPLHTLDLDGKVEPFRPGGYAVHATDLLALVAPEFLPVEKAEHPDDEPWGIEAGRVDRDQDELILRLAEVPWHTQLLEDGHPRTIVIALPLTDAGPPRVLARATRRPGHHVELVL